MIMGQSKGSVLMTCIAECMCFVCIMVFQFVSYKEQLYLSIIFLILFFNFPFCYTSKLWILGFCYLPVQHNVLIIYIVSKTGTLLLYIIIIKLSYYKIFSFYLSFLG